LPACFIGFCVALNLSATHLVGSEITYTPVPGSPNHYIATIVVYRYCAASSATLGTTADIILALAFRMRPGW
jgi:hypothetical protein